MNIICDICGSAYSQTAERCPTCGYPRQGNEKTVTAAAAASYTKVKGGRFSSKNVKKRQKELRKAERGVRQSDPNKPLIITIIILLIAIILVSAYIVVSFLRGRVNVPATTGPAASTAATTSPEIPCTGMKLGLEVPVLDLKTMGEQVQLNVQALPAGTTDTIIYMSENPAVAEVSETGLVTVTGHGTTKITVTCGSVIEKITVFCWIETQPTESVPTEPAPTESKPTEPKPTEPKATEPKPTQPKPTEPKPTEAPVLVLDPADASCFKINETFTIYARLGNTTVNRAEVQWSTSDPKVATVENGVVTAVSKGEVTITAEYEGQKATCLVRCRFENPKPTEDREEDQEDQENQGSQDAQPAADWKVRPGDDVSITIDESFRLKVTNSAGETADVIWTMSKEGVVSIEGAKVTGRNSGEVTLKTTIDGVTLTCIIRVK